MRLADVLDTCTVKTVTVATEVSLAEAARALHRDDAAAIIVENGRLRGILTAGDILRFLSLVTSPMLAWQGPVTAALSEGVEIATPEEPISRAILKMTAAGRDYLPIAAVEGIVVVSLCRLLLPL